MILTMVIMLLASSVVSANFSDLEGHWAAGTVAELVEKGIINGFPDGTFKPNETINADAFIKMAIEILGHELGESGGYWASPYINKAIELGIIEEGIYNRPISRLEMAIIAGRFLNNTRVRLPDLIGDAGSIPEGNINEITKAVANGVITGYPDGNFHGDRFLTRAEAATVISRLSKKELSISVKPRKVYTEEERLTKLESAVNMFNIGSRYSEEYREHIRRELKDLDPARYRPYYNKTREPLIDIYDDNLVNVVKRFYYDIVEGDFRGDMKHGLIRLYSYFGDIDLKRLSWKGEFKYGRLHGVTESYNIGVWYCRDGGEPTFESGLRMSARYENGVFVEYIYRSDEYIKSLEWR